MADEMNNSFFNGGEPVPIFKYGNHGNFAYPPQRAGTFVTSSRYVTPDIGNCILQPPEQPLTAYKRYEREMWSDVKMKFPQRQMWELSAVIRNKWEKLTEVEKEPYITAYLQDRKEYGKAQYAYRVAIHPSNAGTQFEKVHRKPEPEKPKTERRYPKRNTKTTEPIKEAPKIKRKYTKRNTKTTEPKKEAPKIKRKYTKRNTNATETTNTENTENTKATKIKTTTKAIQTDPIEATEPAKAPRATTAAKISIAKKTKKVAPATKYAIITRSASKSKQT